MDVNSRNLGQVPISTVKGTYNDPICAITAVRAIDRRYVD